MEIFLYIETNIEKKNIISEGALMIGRLSGHSETREVV